MIETPTISKTAYGTASSQFQLGNIQTLTTAPADPPPLRSFLVANATPALDRTVSNRRLIIQPEENLVNPVVNKRRLVQVFIADPDENIPLEKSLLYTGPQKLTDATDQELYFEIDIKTMLEQHNAYRVTLPNKKMKERVEMLEPARVRDLKMVVVDVAVF